VKRTHTCGALNSSHNGQSVILEGWIDKRRDHGGLIFIDVRDRYGVTQLVFDPIKNDMFELARELRFEYVIRAQGVVHLRPEGMINKNMKTGEIEVKIADFEILNQSKIPPFLIIDNPDVNEDTRLRYRYLDLRRPILQRDIILRHKIMQVMRNFLDKNDFIEIETPYLMKSTPEGARDFLVPSRISKGKFYALPQSPQTYKQLLMISGFDKYFQITKCFRDEDMRADRQPEFTQLDMEMSFIEEDDIYRIVEMLVQEIFLKVKNEKIELPFPRMSFSDAMATYGSDKPDLRYGMTIKNISSFIKDCDFKIFTDAIKNGDMIGGINLKGGSKYSRKQIDHLNQYLIELGGKGIITIKIKNNSWDSSLKNHFTEKSIQKINTDMDAEENDLLIIIADTFEKTTSYLGNLRIKLAHEENLIPKNNYKFCWITNFPLLEYDDDSKRYVARHHPFTSPEEKNIELLTEDPLKVFARAYDLVLNGYELAGGSIRNHKYENQMKVFALLKISPEEAQDKFGFLLDALQFGAPPHGGIAMGLDRLTMILAGKKSIRDVMAFPKTTAALSLMDGSPSVVDENQLQELGITIKHSN